MAGTTLDIDQLLNPDTMGTSIARKWQEWDSLRDKWLAEKVELRNYLYATDTTTTSNARNDWQNSTTVPKLTQIYDNLKANYSAALFPNAHWMRWEANDLDSAIKEKRDTIQAYMETKLRQSGFEKTAERLLDDFILYGNCFATVEWTEDVVDIANDEYVVTYVGPKLVRISPYDIVFNPTAADFATTPKIIRSILQLGEVKRMIERGGNDEYKAVFDKMLGNRREVAAARNTKKASGYIADGFSSIEHYYGSDYVELLTFYGDLYDSVSDTLMENVQITVADRAYVIAIEPIASWLGRAPIYHAGWRERQDNLYAMGPLDNLVGMQYRIDHLENLKADVFDQIAYPILKIRGYVEDFDYVPGERIFLGEEGDVQHLVPDATALNADFQIQQLENKMEELAGAPRQAMGIRTPGEKTAFEVNVLENSANRIFQHKSEQFERNFLEPILNAMLASARRNLDTADVIKVTNDSQSAALFRTITKDDLQGNGMLRPVGASHFAERARRVQNISQMLQVKASDPTVAPHLSGKETARIIAMELGEEKLYGENVAVREQLETQQAMQDAEADNVERLQLAQEQGL